MRQLHLESALSSLQREFPDPKIELEQYPTGPHLVAAIVCMAKDRGDITEDSVVLDLGCGTGMLALGAAFAAGAVIGIDCDGDSLAVAAANAESVDLEDTVQFVRAKVNMVGRRPKDTSGGGGGRKSNNRGGRKGRGRGRGGRGSGGRGVGSASPRIFPSPLIVSKSKDITSDTGASENDTPTDASRIPLPNDGIPLHSRSVDVVLTNPPFGTKADNAGMDVQFLWSALRVARRAVYSFHKRSTRPYLLRTLTEEWGYPNAAVVAEMAFDVPQMYKFHKQKSVDIEVDLIRVEIPRDDDGADGGTEGDNLDHEREEVEDIE